MSHRFASRVYYADTDAGGVMYHANYLDHAERARTEYLRDAGAPHAEMVRQHGVVFMVRRVKMEYFRPARVDDLLNIDTTMLGLKRATVVLSQNFFRDGDRLADIEVTLVCVSVAGLKPVALPPLWRQLLARTLEES